MARVFQAEETADIYFEIKDVDGVLADPTTIEVTVTDPDGTVQADAQNYDTKHDTGKYSYYQNIGASPAKGWWGVSVKTTDGTGGDEKYSVEVEGFKVK